MDMVSIYFEEHHFCFVIICYADYCFSYHMKRHLSAIFVVSIKLYVISSTRGIFTSLSTIFRELLIFQIYIHF